MKTIKFMHLLAILLASVIVHAQDSTASKLNSEKNEKLKVGFLVYDGVEAQDLNGPLDVFVKANRGSGKYDIFLVSATSKKSIKTESGVVQISAQYSIEDAPQADILIIPGAAPDIITALAQNNAPLKKWIVAQNSKTAITSSVCTGSLYLASIGMLNGIKATTHPACLPAMRQNQSVDVKENVRFVLDGKYLTGSGITSGIDVALEIVELIEGKSSADLIARIMVYNRNGNMSFLNDKHID